MRLAKPLVCEFLGTAFLLATVVGSGILADKLDSDIVAVTVLSIAFATGAVLTALVLAFGSISAHFNPAVTLVCALRGEHAWKDVIPYWVTQVAGACAGVMVANLMFDLPAVVVSTTARTGGGLWLGEFVATIGLIAVILGCAKSRPDATPMAVGGYVAGAIWFTSSTCFANPAVTIARALTNTITGIRPDDVAMYCIVQFFATITAALVFTWLFTDGKKQAAIASLKHATTADTERELVMSN